jgi:hypothetical protein
MKEKSLKLESSRRLAVFRESVVAAASLLEVVPIGKAQKSLESPLLLFQFCVEVEEPTIF